MADLPPSSTTPSNPRPARWWPLWVVLFLAAAATLAIRLWPNLSHQQRNLFTTAAWVLSLPAVLLWALRFSRLPGRARVLVATGLLGSLGLLAGLVRIRGVSGDLLPILEWRFQPRQSSRLALPAKEQAANAPVRMDRAGAAGEYTQFQGSRRDSTVDGPPLARDWEARPPKLIWRKDVGPAWAGFAVSQELAVTLEQRQEQEAVVCYELRSGQVAWTHGDAGHYQTTIAGEGPRTTPTIVDGRVYTMGATGLLNALDLATGRVLWSRNVVEDNQGRVDDWGVSCSPLVTSNLVVVTTGAAEGRSLAAYRASDGTRVWRAGKDRASYSSPALLSLDGQRQIVIFNAHSLGGHHPDTGAVLWEYPWPAGHPHIAMPIVLAQDQLLVSSGYGTGSQLLRVKAGTGEHWQAQRLWKSTRLKSKFANLVALGGFIYGLDDGIMVCLDATTGELKWKEGRYGHGQMILSKDLLLIMAENGEVVLVEPAPEQARVLTRFQALRGKTWNPPALAGSFLVVRNDQQAACYELPTAN